MGDETLEHRIDDICLQCREKPLLGGEVSIDVPGRGSGRGGDVAYRHGRDTLARHESPSRSEQLASSDVRRLDDPRRSGRLL